MCPLTTLGHPVLGPHTVQVSSTQLTLPSLNVSYGCVQSAP